MTPRASGTLRALLILVAMTASPVRAEPLQPLVVGWEQYFRIEAEPVTKAGRSVVKGTVWNTTTWGAKRIQILVDALDAGGRVIDQRVAWLGVDLAGGTHAFFEVPMPASAAYRVSVYAYDSGRGGRWS
jgi:hypothetical protein